MLNKTIVEPVNLSLLDKQIINAIQDGFALTRKPFLKIAIQLKVSEQEVIQRLKYLQCNGTIKRSGVVVRHRELGYRANAMVVWDIPDQQVDSIAKKIASFDCVTLCYRRPRRLPDWSYNLFSMIHGQNHNSVIQRLEDIVEVLGLEHITHEPLFSTRRFKQQGGRFIQSSDIKAENIKATTEKYKHLPDSLRPVYG